MEKIRINLQDLLLCLSKAQDLIFHSVTSHQQQVAYLSYRLSEKMGLPEADLKNIYFAALIHDVGALSTAERFSLIENEPLDAFNHAFIGAKLLEEFRPLSEAANIIKYHHFPWNYGNGAYYNTDHVPLGSHIIHLADRACAKIDVSRNVISQIPQIIKYVNDGRDTIFNPEILDALNDISINEYVWLDLISNSPISKIQKFIPEILSLNIDDLIDLSCVFSYIIDFRSMFTAVHSAGVANTAKKLTELVGFSAFECKEMLIAGYLHDLGKLAISNDVLEKNAKLSDEEFNEIRSHTYYTYQLLDAVPQFETIKTWASFHHERLDGKGYPFHIKGEDLSLGSRIMAVADVFTAITENRPYRKGMEDSKAIGVLNNMVSGGAIDANIVDLLVNNYDEINKIREKAQNEASEKYNQFTNDGSVSSL